MPLSGDDGGGALVKSVAKVEQTFQEVLELPDVVGASVRKLLVEFDDWREALGGGLDLRAKDPDPILVGVLGEVDEDWFPHDGGVGGWARGDALGKRARREALLKGLLGVAFSDSAAEIFFVLGVLQAKRASCFVGRGAPPRALEEFARSTSS